MLLGRKAASTGPVVALLNRRAKRHLPEKKNSAKVEGDHHRAEENDNLQERRQSDHLKERKVDFDAIKKKEAVNEKGERIFGLSPCRRNHTAQLPEKVQAVIQTGLYRSSSLSKKKKIGSGRAAGMDEGLKRTAVRIVKSLEWGKGGEGARLVSMAAEKSTSACRPEKNLRSKKKEKDLVIVGKGKLLSGGGGGTELLVWSTRRKGAMPIR